MRKFLLFGAALCTSSAAFAQPNPPVTASDAEVYGADFFQTFSEVPVELPADSPLRHELFDSIRKLIRPDNKFEGSLKVYRNWAFFVGRIVDAKGKVVYYVSDNGSTSALWLRTGEGERIAWKLVDVILGGQFDTPYKSWPYRFGAPYLLLGMDPALGQSGANMIP